MANLAHCMLADRSQAQKATYIWFHSCEISRVGKSTETKHWGSQELGGGGNGNDCFQGEEENILELESDHGCTTLWPYNENIEFYTLKSKFYGMSILSP